MSGPLDVPSDEEPRAPGPSAATGPPGEEPCAPGPLDFAPDDADASAGPRPPAVAPARPARTRPPGRLRYAWIVGAIALVALAWIAINTLRTQGGSSTGPAAGSQLPPFAAPLALGDLDGDANVARKADSGAAGRRPACEVRGPQILNACELAERGPVVLAFLATRGGDCTRELDRLQAAQRAHPGIQLAAVAIRGDRGRIRRLIAEHGWRFPVAIDRDGAVANLYGVAVCPQVTYAYPGGEVRGTTIGAESEAVIRGRVARLEAAARERGWSGG